MKLSKTQILSVLFLALGVLFLVNSKANITGAVIGVSSFSSLTSMVSGLFFLVLSLATYRYKPEQERPKKDFSLEQVLNEDFSNKGEKSLRHFGKKLLKKHHGSKKAESLHNRQDYFLELGKVAMIIKNYGSLSVSDKKKVNERYNIKEFSSNNLGDVLGVDAKKLNIADGQGRRGDLRYVFDPESHKFRGVAFHRDSDLDYRWVD